MEEQQSKFEKTEILVDELPKEQSNTEKFIRRNWSTIATIIMLLALVVIIYYGYMMFRMGRDPCGLCEDMFKLTCVNPRMPGF